MSQSIRWAIVIGLLSVSAVQAESLEKPEAVFASQKLIEVEADLVSATNAERERHGLPPLDVDFKLMSTSRRHTAWMANSGAFQHGNYPVAENIAWGQESVREAIRSWMNSPGHRANILGSRYRKLGVAAYQGRSGRIYWTQQFN